MAVKNPLVPLAAPPMLRSLLSPAQALRSSSSAVGARASRRTAAPLAAHRCWCLHLSAVAGSRRTTCSARNRMRLAVAAASRLRMRAAARRWHTAIECALPWRQQAADVTAIERTNQQAASTSAAHRLPLLIARQSNAPCRGGSTLPPHARRSSPMALQSNAPTSKPPAHQLSADWCC